MKKIRDIYKRASLKNSLPSLPLVTNLRMLVTMRVICYAFLDAPRIQLFVHSVITSVTICNPDVVN